jgi:hypothetical protein
MLSSITNNFNSLYNGISNLFHSETEEESLKNLFNIFFNDYEEILNENKLIFNIYLYKKDNDTENNNMGILYLSQIFISKNNKKNNKNNKNSKYKFSFGYENYEKIKEGIYIDIYMPYGMRTDYIIIKKYYYKISSLKNNKNKIIKNFELYNDEPTFRSIITEIIDEIKNI